MLQVRCSISPASLPSLDWVAFYLSQGASSIELICTADEEEGIKHTLSPKTLRFCSLLAKERFLENQCDLERKREEFEDQKLRQTWTAVVGPSQFMFAANSSRPLSSIVNAAGMQNLLMPEYHIFLSEVRLGEYESNILDTCLYRTQVDATRMAYNYSVNSVKPLLYRAKNVSISSNLFKPDDTLYLGSTHITVNDYKVMNLITTDNQCSVPEGGIDQSRKVFDGRILRHIHRFNSVLSTISSP